METTASRLRKEIEKKGLTFIEFAKITDVTPSTLSRFLNDKQKITNRYLSKAATALNVSVEYLLLQKDEENSFPSHNIQKTSDKYKLDMIIQFAEQLGYKVYEFIDLHPNISFITNPNKKVWLREGDIFLEEYYIILNKTGFPLGYDENKKEKINKKQMMDKIKKNNGSVTHEFLIISPCKNTYCIKAPILNVKFLSVFNIFETIISQVFEDDEYIIEPIDALIKHRDVLIENGTIDSFIDKINNGEEE